MKPKSNWNVKPHQFVFTLLMRAAAYDSNEVCKKIYRSTEFCNNFLASYFNQRRRSEIKFRENNVSSPWISQWVWINHSAILQNGCLKSWSYTIFYTSVYRTIGFRKLQPKYSISYTVISIQYFRSCELFWLAMKFIKNFNTNPNQKDF